MTFSMIPTQSLLLLRSIALTAENGLYLAGGTIAGSLIILAIIVGSFIALYAPDKEDE